MIYSSLECQTHRDSRFSTIFSTRIGSSGSIMAGSRNFLRVDPAHDFFHAMPARPGEIFRPNNLLKLTPNIFGHISNIFKCAFDWTANIVVENLLD